MPAIRRGTPHPRRSHPFATDEDVVELSADEFISNTRHRQLCCLRTASDELLQNIRLTHKVKELETYAQIVKNFATCCICLEVFTLPRTMACGHTFCFVCLETAKIACRGCPTCRDPITPALRNYALEGIVEAVELLIVGAVELFRERQT